MFKKIFIIFIFLFLGGSNIFSQSCPSQTTYGDTWATLVGEIQDNGGDPNITAWFEWGISSFSLSNRTQDQSFYTPNPPQKFCQTLNYLQPCTTYYYRAVSRNSGGVSHGNTYSFRTSCVANLSISCYASPNPANAGQTVVFTANASGGTGSYFYSWSGACSGYSSTCSSSFSSAGLYTANITVTSGNQTQSASCSVNVSSSLSSPTTINPSQTNQPPVPIIAFTPEDIRPGTIVTFDASQSYDPDGFINSYEWRINNELFSNLKTFRRALASGIYRIKLTVTDNQGAQASKEILISVGRTTYLTRTQTVITQLSNPIVLQKTSAKLVDLLLEPSYRVNICSQNKIQMTLINNTSVNRQITIKANGEAGAWFEPQERKFILAPQSTQVISWLVNVPCWSINAKDYKVDFKVSTPGDNYKFSTLLQARSVFFSPLLGFIGTLFNGFDFRWLLFLLLIILINTFIWLKVFRKR